MAAALALATSVCYGLSNFVGPLLSRGNPLFVVLVSGQAVAFAVSGAVVLAGPLAMPAPAALAAALGAGLGNAGGLLAFYRAAALGPLSIVAPVAATSAGVPVLAGLVAGEALTAARLTGIALALAGVVLAARRPAGGADRLADRTRSLAWAVGAALGFGVFLTLIAPASVGGTFWAVFASRGSLLVVLVATAVVLRHGLVARPRALPRLAAPGLLLFAGTLAYSAATRRGDLSVVSVLASSAPVVTVALAFAVLRERPTRAQWAGVAAALAGVALLALQ